MSDPAARIAEAVNTIHLVDTCDRRWWGRLHLDLTHRIRSLAVAEFALRTPVKPEDIRPRDTGSTTGCAGDPAE